MNSTSANKEIKPLYFSTSGIRGKANTVISPDLGLRIGRSIVDLSIKENRESKLVIVGYDNRRNSKIIADSLLAGITSLGYNGLTFSQPVPTPLVIYSTVTRKAAAGLIVTGSHLPKDDNGIILFDNQGSYFKGLLAESTRELVSWEDLGKIIINDEDINNYNEFLSQIHLRVMPQKLSYNVLIDTVHGPMQEYIKSIAKKIFSNVFLINDEFDDTFPGRISEPTPENLGKTAEIIKNNSLDLGVSTDMDGDRVIFINAEGKVITGDYIGAIIAKEIWQKNPQAKIVVPVNTSAIIEHVAEMTNGQIVYCKVGPPSIIEAMRKENAIFAFEETGKYIFSEYAIWPDSVISLIVLAKLLYSNTKTLSELVKELPTLFSLKTKLPHQRGNELIFYEKVIKKIGDLYPDAMINDLDGLRINFPDKSWLLIRQSGTEDNVRIFSEHFNETKCIELNQIGRDLVESISE